MARGRERIVICLDCGAEVKTTTSRTKRCKECAYKYNKERQRVYEARRRAKLESQEKPPFVIEDYHFCDSQENIQKCLNCTRPKCGNCLGYSYTKKADRGKKDE